MSLENIEAYRNFPSVQITRLTVAATYKSLYELLDTAGKLPTFVVARVLLRKPSASVNVGTSASPSTDVTAVGTTDELLLPVVNPLRSIFVSDGAGTATIDLLLLGR